MLSPLDKRWRTPEPGERSVDYTNLSPGTYTLRVIGSNNDDVWNNTGATLKIYVRPYFYQTAWFYIVLVVLTVLLVYLVYWWRVHAIENKNRELLKVNTELDRFVYSASHDLRAPLASVLGLVKLARLDADPEQRIQYLDMVEKSILKLDGFIHDIINYSRNARTALEISRINFEAVLNEILETLKYQENSSRIRKDVIVDGRGDFYTDMKRLDIILYNLITNAIKYHNLEQADPWIRIQVSYNEHRAMIWVSDNGKGIEEKHLQNIFNMFYRADETSTGSGLGLFIAQEAVEKLKGRLSADSVPRKGSTFTIEIPSLKPNSHF